LYVVFRAEAARAEVWGVDVGGWSGEQMVELVEEV
jgi:hypothetical protein